MKIIGLGWHVYKMFIWFVRIISMGFWDLSNTSSILGTLLWGHLQKLHVIQLLSSLYYDEVIANNLTHHISQKDCSVRTDGSVEKYKRFRLTLDKRAVYVSSYNEQHSKLRWAAMCRIQSYDAQCESNTYLQSNMQCNPITALRRTTNLRDWGAVSVSLIYCVQRTVSGWWILRSLKKRFLTLTRVHIFQKATDTLIRCRLHWSIKDSLTYFLNIWLFYRNLPFGKWNIFGLSFLSC